MTPNFNRCDERLQARIQEQTDELCRDIWQQIFHTLDATNGRFVIDGDDAGTIAQIAVEAIRTSILEALAK